MAGSDIQSWVLQPKNYKHTVENFPESQNHAVLGKVYKHTLLEMTVRLLDTVSRPKMIVDGSQADNEAELLLGLFKYLSRKSNTERTIRLYMLSIIKNNKMAEVKITGNLLERQSSRYS